MIATGKYDLDVIWTPGHSPGHICLYEPRNRLLFSGDHILPIITPNISYRVQCGDNPLGDYINALRKLQNVPVAQVLPAHEEPFTGLRERIRGIIDHHGRRKEEIRNIMAGQPLSAYEISLQVAWDMQGLSWEKLPPLHKRGAVTETIAHLEHMRWEGEVTRIAKEGSLLYETL